MSRSRVPVYLGTAAVASIGYYFYRAGGDPKVAEKKFEADVHKASAKVKSEIPGRADEAKAKADELTSRAGAKFDSYVDQGKGKVSEAEAKARQYKADTLAAIDRGDRKVEAEAAKAKEKASSWFGGK